MEPKENAQARDSTSVDAVKEDGVYLLEIFNGIHRGATVVLHPGQYMLGCNDECDIVLEDDSIKPEHMMLTCNPDGHFSITAQSGDFLIDGNPCEEDETDLEIHKIVTIGQIHLAVVQQGDGWQPDDLPDLGVDEAAIPETDGDEARADVQDRDRDTRAGLKRWWPLAAIGGVGFLFYFATYALSSIPVQNHELHINQVKKIFEELNLPEPDITINAEGIMEVVGYTKLAAEKQRVMEKLKAMPSWVHARIFAGENIVSSCRIVLARLSYAIEPDYVERGTILLKGFIAAKRDIDIIISRLKQDVGGLQSIQERLWVLDDVVPELIGIIKDNELDESVRIEIENGYPVSVGLLRKYEEENWRNAKMTVAQLFGDDFILKDKIEAAEKQLPGKVILPITGVTLGEHPYITMTGNRVYFVGSPLKNGLIISEIRSDRIVIDRDGRKYYYDLKSKDNDLEPFHTAQN
ncbi:MAG: type III secretion system inner membrane ring subunit SctD [Desulfobacteraceae bacterium]|jgi:type III secretion system YscD/HrpQ family protein